MMDDRSAAFGNDDRALWQRLFELTSDAVFIDVDGLIAAVNRAGLELYDCASADELIGTPTVDLVPPGYRDFIAARAERARAGVEHAHHGVEEILRRDGSRRAVDVSTGPILFEGRPGVLAVLRDVTTQQSAATALEARARSSRIYASVSLLLATATHDTLDEAIDETLRSIATSEGVSRAYVILFTDEGLIHCTHEWCAPGVEPQIEYVQEFSLDDYPWSVGKLSDCDVVHVPDLDQLPPEAEPERQSFGRYGVRSVLQVPMIVGTEVIGLVGFNAVDAAVDWSDEAIDLVRSVADAIATALTRRRSERNVRAARDDAQAANAAKDTFLSRMSHELRTPLNAVLGFTELMLLEDRPHEDREALERIRASGAHLLALVDDILDVSRIEAGGLALEIESVDLLTVLDEAMMLASHDGGEDLPSIVVEREGLAGVAVEADRKRLQQSLVNVLSNAVKYNRPGGSVTIGAALLDDDRVRISVTDTGVGIPGDRLDQVFEPFERLGQELSDIEGTGIGLALTRMLVERMSGTLELTSTEGVGTTVTIDLAGGQADAAPRPGLPLVLSVDANDANQLLVRRIVQDQGGLEFIGASNVTDALQLARTRGPALILLDTQLPDGSGIELIEALCSDPATAAIPLVVMTGDVSRERSIEAVGAGATEFLAKPVTLDLLRTTIRFHTSTGSGT